MDLVIDTAVKYNDIFMSGAKITIIISLLSCFFGLLLGIILAFMKISGIKILQAIATVYVEINEQNKGTVEDPILYNGNMILYANKYYSQNNIIYKCIRDSVIPLYDSLNNLINIYVKVHNV